MLSLDTYSILSWSGREEDDSTGLQSVVEGKLTEFVPCHAALTVNRTQTRAFLCDNTDDCTVSRWELTDHRSESLCAMLFFFLSIIWCC